MRYLPGDYKILKYQQLSDVMQLSIAIIYLDMLLIYQMKIKRMTVYTTICGTGSIIVN